MCTMAGASQAAGIDHRNTFVHGKPDASERICDHGPMPLHAFDATQAVSKPILAKVAINQRARQQFVALYAQHMTRCRYP
jgi:hypothetical protein